jgi:hypothetical protein
MQQSSSTPLVEVRRSSARSRWQGFLVAESDAVVVLHQVSDRFDLDGYVAFPRLATISINESFQKLDLIQRALRLNRQTPKIPENIDCTSVQSLMASAQAQFGALVIEREKHEPGEVQVGAVRITSDDTYVLRWLSPNAEWENDDRPFRYRDITKLEFGSAYEQTLLAVARCRESDG